MTVPSAEAQTSAVSFSSATYSVTGSTSAATSATITINRAAGGVGVASVRFVAYWSHDDAISVYSSTDNTAGVVLPEVDFGQARVNSIASGTVTWSAGDFSAKTFTVPVRSFGTGTVRGRGTLQLALVTPSGSAAIGTQNTAKLFIEDPNAPAAGVIQFAKPVFYAKKDAGNLVVTLTRSGGTTGAASVQLSTSSTLPDSPIELKRTGQDSTLTGEIPATATAGTDYTAQTNVVISWAAGESGDKTVSIPIVNNTTPTAPYGNQIFGLTLSNISGASTGYLPAAHACLVTPSRSVFRPINYPSRHAFRVHVPPAGTPVRGVLFFLPGSGNNTVGVASDPQWQQFANALGFAVVGASNDGFTLLGDSNSHPANPSLGAGKLLANLKLIADATGRPEIANAPVIFSGFSMGGFNSIESVICMPERFLGFIGHKSSQWVPLTDTQITSTPSLLNVPGLLIAGGSGDTNVEPSWIEENAFQPWRSRGAQIAAVPDWGTGHNHEGSLGFNLAFSFIGEVVRLRYPVGADPVAGPVSLNSIPTANGWLGDTYYSPLPHVNNDTTITGIRRQSGQVAAGWDAFPTVAPVSGAGAYTPTGGQTATQFSWLPSETFARAYRTAVQRAEPTYRYAANPDNSGSIEGNSTGAPLPANSPYRLLRREMAPLYAPVQFTAPSILNSAVVGQTYPIEVDVRTLTNVASVQFFDGPTSLGTDTTAPYTTTWTPAATGISTLNALVTLSSGTITQYSAFQPVAVNTGTAAGILSFAHTAYDAFRSTGNATVTVLRQGGKTGAISALVSVGGSGTAVSGTDYTFTSATVNWADGDAAPKTVTIPLTTTQKRLNRTLHLTLSTPTGGATLFTTPGQNSLAPYCPDRLKTFVTLFDDTATNLGLWSNTLLAGGHGPFRALYAENGFFLQCQGGGMSNSDTGQMLTRALSGDGTVTARLHALSRSSYGNGTEGRFAVVLRNGTTANAAFVGAGAMIPSGTTNLRLEAVRRTTAGAGLAVTASPVTLTTPTTATWLRLTRAGDTFTAQYSTDGSAWTTIEAVTLAGLPSNLTAGLVFTGGHRSYAGWCVADSVTITGPNAPAVPTTLSATPTASQINLSWTDASANETGFIIERSTDGTNFHYLATAAANANTYTDSAVSIGNTYTYRLRSNSASGDSGASTSTSAALPSPPVITANQTTANALNSALSYQIVASQSPASYALTSGSLPPGVTLNTNTGLLSGTPTALGTFTPSFTATNTAGTSPAVVVTLTIVDTALILQEPFAYTVGSNSPDPDGGLNSGNGLPATNLTGSPSGTSTGLYGNYGTTLDVATGLTYAQGSKTLTTSGGSATPNNATWGTAVSIYRNMTTDPNLARRVGNVNTGNLGVDGDTLYLSFLARSSSTTIRAFWLNFSNGSRNIYVGNTATKWSIEDNAAGLLSNSTGAFTANTTALLVVRLTFAAGATDTMSLWVNPPLGGPLPATPDATLTIGADWSFNQLNFRPLVLGTMTMDELRLGTTYASVTPYTEPPPTAPSSLAASQASSTQINLTWADNSTDETGFKLERSPDGSTGWTQIATPSANATSYSDTGLSASTTYYYRLRATNAAGDSTYTATASASTQTGMQAFRATYSLAADGSQDTATPAGDGVPNLLKYAFNMIGSRTGQALTLATPNASVLDPSGSAGLPYVSLLSAPSSTLQLTYLRRKAASNPGITYAVEFTDDLATWAVNPSATESTTSIDATFERVTVTDSVAAPAKRFARVKVTSL